MKSNDPKYMMCYCAKKYCREDISLIENYDQMMADTTQRWCCHHRREISENKSYKQLIDEGLYYNRPAAELIFMTFSDHVSLLMKGKTKGNKNTLGKPKSEATRNKMSEARKGKHWFNNGEKEVYAKECPEGFTSGRLVTLAGKTLSEATKRKIGEASKGKHWFNNGEKEVYRKECPEGFTRGRLQKGVII